MNWGASESSERMNPEERSQMKPDIVEQVYSVIAHRRSVRSYAPQHIPPEQLEQLVEAARWAPSPSNIQSWRFVAVQEPGQLATLTSVSPGFPREATAAIVVCSDQRDVRGCEEALAKILAAEEAAMAAQNILLTAHAMALGSCVVASFSPTGLSELLELPEPVRPILIVAIGVPREQPVAPERKPLSQILSWETYQEE
jgi:nitroreductase